jgi:hypothetical protein
MPRASKKQCAKLSIELQRMIIEKVVDLNMYAYIEVWNQFWEHDGDFGGMTGVMAHSFRHRMESTVYPPTFVETISWSQYVRNAVLKYAVIRERKIRNKGERDDRSWDCRVERREVMRDHLRNLYAVGGLLSKGDGVLRYVKRKERAVDDIPLGERLRAKKAKLL